MLRWLYNLLIYAAVPIALLANLWRSRADASYRERMGERLGFAAIRARESIWVHAVSVGEVQAAAALIRKLAALHPTRPLIVTTGTPTGAARVKALFGSNAQHVYLPYDTPGSVRRFFDRIEPRVAIVMETEVWPNLFRECARRRIPLVIASARLSQKSVRGYRWLASLFKDALARDIEIAAQTRGDADRFIGAGANPARTHVVGNIKFDLDVPDEVRERGRAVRAQWGDRLVWVAGSTHPGEEEQLLDAHARLRENNAEVLLVMVPRHPQRFDEAKATLRERGVEFAARSQQEVPAATTSVLLVDTLGELMTFYAAADIAFVGGSLAPVGGHNLLEPAALALPVLTGPHHFNSPDVARALIERGAVSEVRSADELARRLQALFDDPAARQRQGALAQCFVAENRGALERLLALLEPHLR